MILTDLNPALLQQLAARLSITNLLTRYSRGIDRCDLETLKSVFWEDATADYGSAPENAWSWAAATLAALSKMNRTMHTIGNMLVECEESVGTGETYCTAYHEFNTSDGVQEMIVGGRYLDRFECRNGEWRIARRLYIMDWNRNGPSTAIWDEGIYAGLTRRGSRFPDDPSYRERP